MSDLARVRLEVRILEVMGDREAAQVLPWRTFETTLDEAILRDHLAQLPDFAEFEALDRAFAHAAGHEQRYRALAFFLAWPRGNSVRSAGFVVKAQFPSPQHDRLQFSHGCRTPATIRATQIRPAVLAA